MELPEALLRLLRKSDGGYFASGAVLRVPDGSTASAFEVLPVVEVAPTTERLLGRVHGLVAWARDGSGNALLMSGDGQIFFWDHDTDARVSLGRNLEELASHFEMRPASDSPRATTSSPLRELLARGATASEVDHLLEQALSVDTAEAFAVEAANARRVDVIAAIATRSSPFIKRLAKPLKVAAALDQVDAIRVLVAAGLDVDATPREGDNTPLMAAASYGSLDAVLALLEMGADPTATNRQGRTALRMAMSAKRDDVVAKLREVTPESC